MPPPALQTLASTVVIAAIKHRTKPFYGLQFHPEVATRRRRTVSATSAAARDVEVADIDYRTIADVRERVGKSRGSAGCRVGDSSVVAALLVRAIGNRSPASSWTTARSAKRGPTVSSTFRDWFQADAWQMRHFLGGTERVW